MYGERMHQMDIAARHLVPKLVNTALVVAIVMVVCAIVYVSVVFKAATRHTESHVITHSGQTHHLTPIADDRMKALIEKKGRQANNGR